MDKAALLKEISKFLLDKYRDNTVASLSRHPERYLEVIEKAFALGQESSMFEATEKAAQFKYLDYQKAMSDVRGKIDEIDIAYDIIQLCWDPSKLPTPQQINQLVRDSVKQSITHSADKTLAMAMDTVVQTGNHTTVDNRDKTADKITQSQQKSSGELGLKESNSTISYSAPSSESPIQNLDKGSAGESGEDGDIAGHQCKHPSRPDIDGISVADKLGDNHCLGVYVSGEIGHTNHINKEEVKDGRGDN